MSQPTDRVTHRTPHVNPLARLRRWESLGHTLRFWLLLSMLFWHLPLQPRFIRADDDPPTEEPTTPPEENPPGDDSPDPDTGGDPTTTPPDETPPETPEDPGPPDSDGDGVSDEEEDDLGSDPTNPDSDYDGITDGDEVNLTETDPTTSDSNGDGVSDYNEFYGDYVVDTSIYGEGVTPYDWDGDGIRDPEDPNPFDAEDNRWDSDGDYVPDDEDSNPGIPWLWNDWNHNGVNDDAEPGADGSPNGNDADGDGIADEGDSDPYDPLLWNDWNFNGENDGDEDWDGDGVLNRADSHPNDNCLWCDWNGNGTNDDLEGGLGDSDGDGYADNIDSHSMNSSLWNDWNNNGVNDEQEAADSDADADGVPDNNDSDPQDPGLWSDWNRNGVNDNEDSPTEPDSDGDGHFDSLDSDPYDIALWSDWNHNGANDDEEVPDSDGDGHPDFADSNPNDANIWNDQNGNGINDDEEYDSADPDADSHPNCSDSHPLDPALWNDWNGNGINDDQEAGDLANTDTDGDGYTDGIDTHPTDPALWNDHNNDGVNDQDQTPPDSDHDGISDDQDMYPFDFDNDGLPDSEEWMWDGDPSNPDSDGDGLLDGVEAYQTHTLLRNVDTDGDGITDYEEAVIFQTDPLQGTPVETVSTWSPACEADRPREVASAESPSQGGVSLVDIAGLILHPPSWTQLAGVAAASLLGATTPVSSITLTGDQKATYNSTLAGTPATSKKIVLKDSDGDGIPDVIEQIYYPSLDPGNPADAAGDLDGDGFSNLTEFQNGWPIYSPGGSARPLDFDGDGITDIVEDFWARERNGLLNKYRFADAAGDPDGDGLLNREEVVETVVFHAEYDSPVLLAGTHMVETWKYRSDPGRVSSAKVLTVYLGIRGDNDGDASRGAQTTVYGWQSKLLDPQVFVWLQHGIKRDAASPAAAPGTTVDWTKYTYAASNLADGSGNKLPDGYDYWRSTGAFLPGEPASADVDQDGLPNIWEMFYGLSYRKPTPDMSTVTVSDLPFAFVDRYLPKPVWVTAAGWDQVNAVNLANWTKRWGAMAASDPDADGLSNQVEYYLGTNPVLADSDGDGYFDGAEYLMRTDPRDRLSVPHPINLLGQPVAAANLKKFHPMWVLAVLQGSGVIDPGATNTGGTNWQSNTSPEPKPNTPPPILNLTKVYTAFRSEERLLRHSNGTPSEEWDEPEFATDATDGTAEDESDTAYLAQKAQLNRLGDDVRILEDELRGPLHDSEDEDDLPDYGYTWTLKWQHRRLIPGPEYWTYTSIKQDGTEQVLANDDQITALSETHQNWLAGLTLGPTSQSRLPAYPGDHNNPPGVGVAHGFEPSRCSSGGKAESGLGVWFPTGHATQIYLVREKTPDKSTLAPRTIVKKPAISLSVIEKTVTYHCTLIGGTLQKEISKAPTLRSGAFVIPEDKEVSEQIYTAEFTMTPFTSLGGGNLAWDQTEKDLLPVELAPEVLAVNTNFDERKLKDGFAKPDAEDTSLQAISGPNAGKIVTTDLHEGFFGLRPGTLPYTETAGAVVKIKKLDKTDPATGTKQTGHVRMYSVWGDTDAEVLPIELYNPDSLVANDIGPTLYGADPNVQVRYYLEGVKPGKITLEFSYQKGSISFKHEQEFLVCTQKTPDEWLNDAMGQVKLETGHDLKPYVFPGGVSSWKPTSNFIWHTRDVAEIYEYYARVFKTNKLADELHWPGIGKMVGGTVYAGLCDLQSDMFSDVTREFMGGQILIFREQGWQHRAYRASGYYALKYVADHPATTMGKVPNHVEIEAWKMIERGIQNQDAGKVRIGVSGLLSWEQTTVIEPMYQALANRTGLMASISGQAKNPIDPTASSFAEVVRAVDPSVTPYLPNSGHRMLFMFAGPDAITNLWYSKPPATRSALVDIPIKTRASSYVVFGRIY